MTDSFKTAVSIGPADTSPCDTDAWTQIGDADLSGFQWKPDERLPLVVERPESITSIMSRAIADYVPPAPPSGAEVLANIRAVMKATEKHRVPLFDPDWGLPIVTSEHVKPGTVYLGSDFAYGGGGYVMSMSPMDCRPFTEAEYAGVMARRIVRHGMADVLQWLGEEVGPAPEDPMPHVFVFMHRVMIRDTHIGPNVVGMTTRYVDPETDRI